ncbi:MAG: helix-turn-helix domain-containing protein [Candidatus Nezhaarchaeales archaeon]
MKVDPEALKEMWVKGLSVKEIAKAFNVTRRAVYYWRKKLDLPAKKRRKYDWERFKELYLRGLSYKEVAERVGCSRGYAYEVRRRLNLPPRSRWGEVKTVDGVTYVVSKEYVKLNKLRAKIAELKARLKRGEDGLVTEEELERLMEFERTLTEEVSKRPERFIKVLEVELRPS